MPFTRNTRNNDSKDDDDSDDDSGNSGCSGDDSFLIAPDRGLIDLLRLLDEEEEGKDEYDECCLFCWEFLVYVTTLFVFVLFCFCFWTIRR